MRLVFKLFSVRKLCKGKCLARYFKNMHKSFVQCLSFYFYKLTINFTTNAHFIIIDRIMSNATTSRSLCTYIHTFDLAWILNLKSHFSAGETLRITKSFLQSEQTRSLRGCSSYGHSYIIVLLQLYIRSWYFQVPCELHTAKNLRKEVSNARFGKKS